MGFALKLKRARAEGLLVTRILSAVFCEEEQSYGSGGGGSCDVANRLVYVEEEGAPSRGKI